MKTKICCHCKNKKSLKEFNKNKSILDKHRSECKECSKIYRQTENYQISKEKYRKSIKWKITHRNYSQSAIGIYNMLKFRVNKTGNRFSLKLTDFIKWYNKQKRICVYCKRTEKEGIEDYNNKFKRLTIDRKNNDLSYYLNNIVLCCYRCNTIKGNTFIYNQMLKIGKIIKNNLSK